MIVFDNDKARKNIKKFGLEKQYKKSCYYIEIKEYSKVQLKLRKPKSAGVYQFRITKKFRALATKKDEVLYVFHISDHQ